MSDGFSSYEPGAILGVKVTKDGVTEMIRGGLRLPKTCPATAASWGQPDLRCELPVDHEGDHETQISPEAPGDTVFVWEDES